MANRSVQIIKDNENAQNDSFLFFLHEKNQFSENAFWELYDAIDSIQKEGIQDESIIISISLVYQEILKEVVYHFDPQDLSAIEDFPSDYRGYIERLDYVIQELYSSRTDAIDDSIFELPYREGEQHYI